MVSDEVAADSEMGRGVRMLNSFGETYVVGSPADDRNMVCQQLVQVVPSADVANGVIILLCHCTASFLIHSQLPCVGVNEDSATKRTRG